jgi:hypothetical protein
VVWAKDDERVRSGHLGIHGAGRFAGINKTGVRADGADDALDYRRRLSRQAGPIRQAV